MGAADRPRFICPHCGELIGLRRDGLTKTHDYPKLTRQVCPGSGQNPRCAESDGRPLWSGGRNRYFEAAPHSNATAAPVDGPKAQQSDGYPATTD